MDTCTNCGAILRPEAKFCTTCGTRLNNTPVNNHGWGTPTSDADQESQETSVLNAVSPEFEQPEDNIGSDRRSFEQWTSAYGASGESDRSSSDDPASRFISARDADVKPTPEPDEEAGSDESTSAWGTPTSVFTPPPPSNWSYSTDTGSSGSAETDDDEADRESDAAEDSSWQAPSTWSTVAAESQPESSEPDAAGFHHGGTDEVDYLSGDENIEASDEEVVSLPPDEARDKAIALADELRRTIRMMSSGSNPDHGAAAMTLTEASLNVGDFSDVRVVLADVKGDPRDIQALGNLAAKINRIDDLLNEHRSLADAIEAALKDLTR